MSKLTKTEAINELWMRANLSWMLDKSQKELYGLFHNTNFSVQTWLLSRRSGKTRTLAIIAIEECLKKPNSIVKFLSPTRIQVRNNLRPLIREILETCPSEIAPEFKAKDDIYYFSNGSEIQLAGSDGGHASKLRGGSSNIAIIDEAQDVTDLEDIIKSILMPTTLTTKGKILISGTPPKNPEHDFIKYIERAETNGSLIKKTIYDNPRLSQEDIQRVIEESGGINSDEFKREYLCQQIQDPSTAVIPEFTTELEKEIIREWPKPPFFDCYESMDLGFKDLTVILYGYFDFRANKIVIEHESVLDFNKTDMDLEKLTKEISNKEKELWFNILTNEIKEPYMRVSDINYIVTNEIMKYSNKKINFKAAKKDDNEAAINNLRSLLGSKKIIIHPRCETLIRHLRNVKWYSKQDRTKFARSPDNGHYDAVDALKYFARHVLFARNPYPADYQMDLKNMYVTNPDKFINQTPYSLYYKIFGMKKKRY